MLSKPSKRAKLSEHLDYLQSIRDKKRALNQEYNALGEIEREAEEVIVDMMQKEGLEKFSSNKGTVSITTAVVPSVKDWDQVYEYIFDNRADYLLQRRLSTTAFRELYEMGTSVPGVEAFERTSVNLRRQK